MLVAQVLMSTRSVIINVLGSVHTSNVVKQHAESNKMNGSLSK